MDTSKTASASGGEGDAKPIAVVDYYANFSRNLLSFVDWLVVVFPDDAASKDLRANVLSILKSREFAGVLMNEWYRHMKPNLDLLDSDKFEATKYESLVGILAEIPYFKELRPKKKFLSNKLKPESKLYIYITVKNITACAQGFAASTTGGAATAELLELANLFAMQFKLEDLRAGKIDKLMTAMPELLAKSSKSLPLLTKIVGNDEEFAYFIALITSVTGQKIPTEYADFIRTAVREYTNIAANIDFQPMLDAAKPFLKTVTEIGTKILQDFEKSSLSSGGSSGEGLKNMFGGLVAQFLGGAEDAATAPKTYVAPDGRSVPELLKNAKAMLESRFNQPAHASGSHAGASGGETAISHDPRNQ